LGKILEVGSGPGYLLIEMAKLGDFEIVGLDISETMIEVAKRNVREAGVHVEILLGNATSMPFSDNAFDFVVSTGSLHHWKDPVKVFDEVYRVLKINGKAMVGDLRRDASKEEMDRIVRRIDSYVMRWGIRHSIKDAYTQSEIMELLSKTKFGKGDVKENPVTLEIWLRK
jgi:ubiquinone/menaquinone biosynthesis C-methylase UbiE